MRIINAKKMASLLAAMFITINSYAQVTVSTDDFMIIDDSNWEGTLTYIDYQTGKPVDIDTKMQVNITEETIEQNVQYVWEPDKNVMAITKIKKNGKFIGKQKVIVKSIDQDGSVHIVTTAKGKDDGKKAIFYFTYDFDASNYKVTKEVRFADSDERYLRNSYKYKRLE